MVFRYILNSHDDNKRKLKLNDTYVARGKYNTQHTRPDTNFPYLSAFKEISTSFCSLVRNFQEALGLENLFSPLSCSILYQTTQFETLFGLNHVYLDCYQGTCFADHFLQFSVPSASFLSLVDQYCA